MPGKKTKRKVSRKASTRKTKTVRANPIKAASTRTTRSANGTLAISAKLKEQLSAHAKNAKQPNWKRAAIEMIERGLAKA